MAKIRIEKDSHDLYRRLGRDDDSGATTDTPFATMKDVFMLCVVLGANKGIKTPLVGPRDLFDESVLKPKDVTILRAIALSEKGDINDLASDADVFRTAQEYANTGVRVILSGFESKEPVQSISHLIMAK